MCFAGHWTLGGGRKLKAANVTDEGVAKIERRRHRRPEAKASQGATRQGHVPTSDWI
jgi:hypothetical protein